MMPICGFRGWLGHRCQRVAEENIGVIAVGGVDGFGKPWTQDHYLCPKHRDKLLKLLGFSLGEDRE